MSRRAQLAEAKRWVIKIGSALLTNDGKGLDKAAIAGWVQQIVALRNQGKEVVLVSSGSVAEGMTRLGWRTRPQALHELQAAAAVGQMGLVQTWESAFQQYGLHTAQILLVHDDLSERQRYLNVRGTMNTLLGLGVVPVVNENDTVATDEIRFGDNDTLAAIVANFVDADVLVILTDQLGMYDSDPRNNPSAKLLHEVRAGDPQLKAMAGGSGALGRGGMSTKVRAAELAARSGTTTVVVGGRIDQVVTRVAASETLGTLFYTDQPPLAARKQWLVGHMQTRGKLTLDDGAVRVVCSQGKSLLPVGVKAVHGEFRRGEMVSCVNPEGVEVARGLVNYSADEARKVLGVSSSQLATVLGYQGDEELIHRDNLVLV
jgi:glutamate 5-kinase